MSVRTWKKIITLFVLLLILTTTATTVFFAVKYSKLNDKYTQIINNENLVDLSDYGIENRDELTELICRIENLDQIKADGSLEYQKQYSSLYVENDFNFVETGDKKICYLTFDDGPAPEVTECVLDILKKYDVKATFFVLYKDGSEERKLYQRMIDEGHTIGVHSASHDYSKIYSSVDAFLADFNRCAAQIEEVIGVKPEIFRFPGGSINSYNESIYQQLIAEMLRRGYTYYDWNVSGNDATGYYMSADDIADQVLSSSGSNRNIVLLHDGRGHDATAEALPAIIEGMMKQGYEFGALDNSVVPICFGY